MTHILNSLEIDTPKWATSRRTHVEEVGYRGLTFSRLIEVGGDNEPLAIEQAINEDDRNLGTYIVDVPTVDLEWTGQANAADCRMLAAAFLNAADLLHQIVTEVK